MELTLTLSYLCLAIGSVSALWPIPTIKNELGTKTMWLSSQVTFDYQSPKGCSTNTHTKVNDAWTRTKAAFFTQNIIPWQFFPKGTQFEPAINSGVQITKIFVNQTEIDVVKPKYSELKEGYTIVIPADTAIAGKNPGEIYIEAQSALGVLHALRSLEQLFYGATATTDAVYGHGPVHIVDQPKFPHRGLNLDVARQWYPVAAIKHVIEAISFNKMNRLHLHVTDSQSWPLEIPNLPELAQRGSYAIGLTYTPEDLQGILDYAEARGIQVIVEIDMPGHTTAIADAYPDLVVGKNIQPWSPWANQPPSGSLKLNSQPVRDFLTKLFNDVLPRLKAHTHTFHVGGDEINAAIYERDPGVNSNDTAVIRPHLQEFTNHVQKQVKSHQMTTFVWEELLLQWNMTLPKSTVVQTWQSDDAAKNATSKGYRVVTGNVNYWYLDCGQGQWLDFGGPAAKAFFPYADWCSPRKNWRLIYSYSPDQFLSAEQAKLVLGGEVHIWSEQIDSISVDMMLWPRASAAAEVLWSGRTDSNGVNRTFADASPRLGEFRERLVAKGVAAQPVMQLWCFQNLGDCELNTA